MLSRMGLGLGGLTTTRSTGVGEYVFTNAEASALVARFSTPPTNARKAIIDTLVGELKTAGVWSKLDALYVMAAADAQAAQRNWIADAYNLSPQNSPTFAADEGYTGNGSTSYLSTGFNPAVASSPKFTLNDSHLGLWSLTDVQEVGYSMGNTNARLAIRSTSANTLRWVLNDGGFRNAGSLGTSVGHFLINRTASNESRPFYNGAAITVVGATASSSVSNEVIRLLGAAQGGSPTFSTHQQSIATIGSALSDAEIGDMYDAFEDYLTAVGALEGMEALPLVPFSKDAYSTWAASLPATGCTVEDLGVGEDGSTIYGLQYGDSGKPVLFFVGGLHGLHEWRNAHILRQFMKYVADPPGGFVSDFAAILGAFQVYCIPLACPSGYIENEYANANGVNLNRNFDYAWAAYDDSGDTGGTKGSAAFSELETQIVRDKVLALDPVGFIDFHIEGIVAGASLEVLTGADEPFWTALGDSYDAAIEPSEYRYRQKEALPQSQQWARTILASNGESPMTCTMEAGETETDLEKERLVMNFALMFGLAMVEIVNDWP